MTKRYLKEKLWGLLIVALVLVLAYLLIGVHFTNQKLLLYSLKIRLPKIMAMILASVCIGASTIIFQTIINNTIVTPCLLGMNALYTLIHTVLVFVFGTSFFIFQNANYLFLMDLSLMAVCSLVIYGWLFKATNHNILYILLIGTVLASLFGSVQSTLIRVMDPNDYDALLSTLVASFSHVNVQIIGLCVLILALLYVWIRPELGLLNVLALGRKQAINLGIDYEKAIRKLLLAVTICIAVATAMIGPISFMGIIVANLARQFLKTYQHDKLILASVLFGVILLIGSQSLVEHVYGYAIPVSVFITIMGGIYFLYLLLAKETV